jgi:putative membrane protein
MILLGLVWTAYLVLAARARRRQGWQHRRTVAFTVGVLLLGAALSPRFDAFADADFSGHAAQHLLLAMVAPVALVLAAPVTLLLRTLPHPAARRLGWLLRSRPAHLLGNPLVALVLSSGGLVVLYFTPLYELSSEHSAVHLLVHAHLVLSGFLFAWVIAGQDPAPRRARVRTRLVVLGVSIAIHASVSQLLYAGLLVQVHEPVQEMRAAGSLMYFGGDLTELLLALTLLLTSRPDPSPRTRRAGRVPTTPLAQGARS